MKKFVIIVILVTIVGLFGGKLFAQQAAPAFITSHITPTLTPTPLVFAIPVNLQVPKLGINATVEQVGLDNQKNMDVPKQDMDVGWYQYGVKPGEMGNAVLAGHFDKKSGDPAVFYHLGDLQLGDDVVVTDEKGATNTFTVVSKDKYPVNGFPIQKVFGNADDRYLNLITCDGAWDTQKHMYGERLVVRTKLKG